MARRSRARQLAFQVLYQDDLNPPDHAHRDDVLLPHRPSSEELTEFTNVLVAGVRRHRAELDEILRRAAENWSLERMTPVDRNILRLGAYEILHCDTPDRVAIDEAVELAKRFGAAGSAPFVNGILDQLMHSGDGQ